ncbi:MAG: hypothetical protein ABSB49_01695 [Polyangia bacterium]|jgi:hypothetical protein
MPTAEQRESDFRLARAAEALADTRDRFVVTITTLECEITHALDWRAWVRRRFSLAMVLAFGVGLLLGRKR